MARKRKCEGMKAFVYMKSDSSKVEIIERVEKAVFLSNGILSLTQKDGDETRWDTHKVKVTLYQN